ncbi:MAG: hypothetical protein QW728_00045 [Thermoplasmata archaeon]
MDEALKQRGSSTTRFTALTLRKNLIAGISISVIFIFILLISLYIWLAENDTNTSMFLTGVMLFLLGCGFVIYSFGLSSD